MLRQMYQAPTLRYGCHGAASGRTHRILRLLAPQGTAGGSQRGLVAEEAGAVEVDVGHEELHLAALGDLASFVQVAVAGR